MQNADPKELAKFSELAHKWWDPESEFRPLHQINPLRLNWIEQTVGKLDGLKVLDVGCGGGILSEAMAQRGAQVLGIDLAERSLKVAQLHALESGQTRVEYREIAAEALAAETVHWLLYGALVLVPLSGWIHHAATEEQARDVETILASLGVDEGRPKFEVWNKVDLLDPDKRAALRERTARDPSLFAVSAVTGEGLESLLTAIAEALAETRSEAVLTLGFADGKRRAWLFAQDVVQAEEQSDDGFRLTVLWTPRQAARYAAL